MSTPRLLAIDPGPVMSAYVILDPADCRPDNFGKVPNDQLLDAVTDFYGAVAVEMVASYGMAVGADVFETCVWIGRYIQAANCLEPQRVKRLEIKLHHCHDSKAKDSNITQALIDRFAPGQPNRGKGTKAGPGWFYGFAADVWQAYALAVYVADTRYRRLETVAAAGGVL
jgi:hypothetical protein